MNDLSFEQRTEPLESRDRRIVIPFEFRQKVFLLEPSKGCLTKWIGEMYFTIVSSSFEKYLRD